MLIETHKPPPLPPEGEIPSHTASACLCKFIHRVCVCVSYGALNIDKTLSDFMKYVLSRQCFTTTMGHYTPSLEIYIKQNQNQESVEQLKLQNQLSNSKTKYESQYSSSEYVCFCLDVSFSSLVQVIYDPCSFGYMLSLFHLAQQNNLECD